MPVELYLDQGNTRCKAWLVADGHLLSSAAVANGDALDAWLAAQGDGPVSVLGASVGSAEARAALLRPLRARVRDERWAEVDTALLPTRYHQPGRLGIDRWLAVLAVADGGRPALVVDAGTALTLDVLGSDGVHEGGFILPGLALQRQVLADATARVSFPEADWSGLAPGRDTAACVGHGSLRALVALTRSLLDELGPGVDLHVTGGDAPLLLPHLPMAEHRPLLLLRGLARAFGRPLPEGV